MRSKLLLEDIGQLARIGGWELHTSNGMSMVWTDEMRTMFEVETGFTPSLEKFISSYKQGEDREALVQAIEKARKNGTGWDLELQMVTEKGNTRWVRSRGKADFENGSCKRLYGFIQDIHEEKLKTIPEKNDDHRYRLLTDNIKSVICLHDREGHFTYISPSFEDVTGLTPSEVIGNLPIDYIHPDDVELVRNHFIQHAKNEANIELKGMEYRYRHKDGHYIWVRSLVRPILENNLVQSLQTDTYVIQKLKDLEESLVSYSSMQNLLMKIASEYINIPLKKVDDAINKSLKEMGEFVDADRTYVFEYDFEKSITNSTYEWCAEGITPQIEELQAVPLKVLQDWIRTHLQGQPMYIPDVSALSKGSLRELLESQDIKSLLALPMMNGDKCVGFVGFDSVKNHHSYTEKELNILKLFSQMLVNIQLRFEEERALVKAKEVAEESQNTLMREAHFYRSMVDNQSFYLIKMSTDARYTFVNDYYCNKVNLNYVSAIGKKMINNIHYDDHYKFLETIQKCLHSPEETHRIVLRSVLRNGEVIQNQWDFKGLSDNKNKLTEILCIGYDISNLIEKQKQLENLVMVTSDQNKRLVNFTYIVSHNIRSHVANISGLMTIMDINNEVHRNTYYGLIEQSVKNLDETIQNLNEIISIQTNVNLNKSYVLLRQKLVQTFHNITGLIQESDAHIANKVPHEARIKVVPAYIDSILINLLTNAIKYRSHERRLQIEINYNEVEDYKVLSVKDNGLGIDLEKYGDKLFGMYKTFHNNSDAKGLGLFITKTQVEAMNGKIQVESEVGEGSTFKVFFYEKD